MKKSQQKKYLKILLLVMFCGAVLWLFVSPRPTRLPVETVTVKVRPLKPEDQQETSEPMHGDEQSQPQAVLALPESPIKPPTGYHGSPRIAIIIDDVGLDLKGSRRAIQLPRFITLSFLPYALRLRDQTHDARELGHELMLHMPMEPMGHADPGPGALLVNQSQDEIRQRLDDALASFTGFDGVNNHMGSKFTSNAADMEIVMNELEPRHLFFLDSRTSAKTVAEETARQHHLPTISRDIFLDDDESYASITNQLKQTEHVAMRKGYAVAIGHPHAATLQAIEEWIPSVQQRGFTLVPVHDLVTALSAQR